MSAAEAKPRYIQLSDRIRADIQNGEWQVGERLPSFTEMYNEHGASTATMQKVYDVLEKEGFIERRSRSGIYVSNPPTVQTKTLAYVIPGKRSTEYYTSSFYAMKLLHSTHQEAAAQGYQLSLSTCNQLRINGFPISGCIVQGQVDLIRRCARSGLPVVSLIADVPEIPSVGTDDFIGFKDITNHLLQLGHRNIAAIIGTDATYVMYDTIGPIRLQGYKAALAERGIQLPHNWVRRIHQYGDELSYANWGYLEMRQWLREGWAKLGCTALVTQNDLTAIGVIKALRQHGYRVPQDVSVTGYDDSGDDAHFDLKLTTVHVPLEEIANKAVHLLAQMLTHPVENIQKVNLPTYIVIGESTSQLEGGH